MSFITQAPGTSVMSLTPAEMAGMRVINRYFIPFTWMAVIRGTTVLCNNRKFFPLFKELYILWQPYLAIAVKRCKLAKRTPSKA